MKRFIKNGAYFVIPFVLYSCLIALIDPFNYLNGFGIINKEKKKAIALDIEPHLYKMIDFKNKPKKNLVLGDSRSNGLYNAMDSTTWSNLAYGGASLKEVIQSFWWAIEIQKPDTVLIGINLNLYNKYNRRFWVEETINRKSNFFTYAFNKYAFNAAFTIITETNQSVEESEPQVEIPGAKEQFWKKKLKGTDKFYKNITYPDEYHKQLTEIAEHCKTEGIKLIFWIPPLHKDYHEVLTRYELEEFEAKFKQDLFSLGDVFDFNYASHLTVDENNFRDPVHFNAQVAKLIEKEIRSYSPRHSTLHKKKWLD